MGKYKKPRRKISKEEFERRLKIWTLVVPIIVAIITSATTIAVALISNAHQMAKVEAKMLASGQSENTEAVKMESESPNSISVEQPIQTEREKAANTLINYWPVIVIILIFSCVFFAAKFIGRAFMRSRYEMVEIDEGEKTDGG